MVAFHFYGGLEIALEVVKKVKMLKFEKSGASCKLKFVHADNAAQNILRELKMKQTWTGQGKWYHLLGNFSLLDKICTRTK